MNDRIEHNKDIHNKDINEQPKTTCFVCKRETSPRMRCVCSGGGKKGGGSGSSKNSGESQSSGALNTSKSSGADTKVPMNFDAALIEGHDISQVMNLPFDSEVISELLSNNMLIIDNKQGQGILLIKLQYPFSDLSPTQQKELSKFIKTILNELEEFLIEKGISSKEKDISKDYATVKKDNQGNFVSLQITSLPPNLYDEFIERLANKTLLPKQNIDQKEKPVYPKGMNHFNSTPFSTKPSPYQQQSKSLLEEDENHLASYHRSPFSTKPKIYRK